MINKGKETKMRNKVIHKEIQSNKKQILKVDDKKFKRFYKKTSDIFNRHGGVTIDFLTPIVKNNRALIAENQTHTK
jgi:hypothetical protein